MNRIQTVTIQLGKEKSGLYESNKIESALDVFNIADKYLANADREHFCVMCLDTKNKVNCINTVSVGSLNSSIVHQREVFKAAILSNANAIILFHNHPSGDPTPSREDVDATKKIAQAGEIMGIELIDHVIVGDGRYYSLKEKGQI